MQLIGCGFEEVLNEDSELWPSFGKGKLIYAGIGNIEYGEGNMDVR